jgi:K+-transporting ATPase ATPase B chain
MSAAHNKKRSLFDRAIVSRASVDALVKLNPRSMMKNPVMFVVEVGSVLTSVLLLTDRLTHHGHFKFDLQITLWLWFTVLFANFAEAMAEGRGKAQADALRLAKSETTAYRVGKSGALEEVPSSQLRADDVVKVKAGQMIPGDGEVMEGVASVDESAITGESAPVIREAGGDRSAVTGGTRVLSDIITVRITSNPAQHSAGGADDHLPAGGGHPPAVRDVLGRAANGICADFVTCLPDPYDHRWVALGHWHRRHG